MKRCVILFFCVFILTLPVAQAQEFDWNAEPGSASSGEAAKPAEKAQKKKWKKKGVPGSPEFVKAIADEARALLPAQKYADGKVVGPETKDEKKQKTFIPQDVIDRIVKEGALVGYAMHCNLDWKNKAYIPMLKQEVSSGLWGKKQMRYIQLVMDLTRMTYAENLPKGCSDEMRDFVTSRMVQ